MYFNRYSEMNHPATDILGAGNRPDPAAPGGIRRAARENMKIFKLALLLLARIYLEIFLSSVGNLRL